jgi:hypothetical protein
LAYAGPCGRSTAAQDLPRLIPRTQAPNVCLQRTSYLRGNTRAPRRTSQPASMLDYIHDVPCMMFLLCVESRCDVTVRLTTGVPPGGQGDSPQRATGCTPGSARRPHSVLPAVGPTFSDGSAVDPGTRHGGRLLWWALEWLTIPLAPSPLHVCRQGRHGLLDHLT